MQCKQKQIKNLTIVFLIAVTMLSVTSAFPASYTLGSEFLINTYTSFAQDRPSVTSNGTDYLVTWMDSGQDGNAWGIYGQRINASGTHLGSEFQINSYTSSDQSYPSVTSNGTDYLVTWHSHGQDGSSDGVYGQLINSSGAFSGSEFLLNTYTSSTQAGPSVTSNGTDYLVTWHSYQQDGSNYGVYGQRINASGTHLGSEFLINTHTTNAQQESSVTSNGTDYLVTWQSYWQDGSGWGIYGQKINASGTPLGSEFQINTYTISNQQEPSITSNGTDYLVAWSSLGQDGSSHYGLYGRLIDASGNFIGSEFLINTYTTNTQSMPCVTSNGTDYLVTWQSDGQDGSGYGVYGQLIDASGNFIGSEFLINTYTTSHQSYPSVTSNGTDYIVTWSSDGQDGSGYGVYGKLITYGGSSTIPEPASALLLLSAVGVFLGKRYKK